MSCQRSARPFTFSLFFQDLINDLFLPLVRGDLLFEDPAVSSDHEKLTVLSNRKEEIARSLEAAYARWEELQ